ncbi:hypothetical protein OPAG_04818 [Rhodococcus opacus PD630]|nr:hypothetical protein Pd630_LPD02773 [Rhodococcus opacus PD630]EHI46318.1 hypothetical protein OPAG_04818 [Rhodococcus opacus PD630]
MQDGSSTYWHSNSSASGARSRPEKLKSSGSENEWEGDTPDRVYRRTMTDEQRQRIGCVPVA